MLVTLSVTRRQRRVPSRFRSCRFSYQVCEAQVLSHVYVNGSLHIKVEPRCVFIEQNALAASVDI